MNAQEAVELTTGAIRADLETIYAAIRAAASSRAREIRVPLADLDPAEEDFLRMVDKFDVAQGDEYYTISWGTVGFDNDLTLDRVNAQLVNADGLKTDLRRRQAV